MLHRPFAKHVSPAALAALVLTGLSSAAFAHAGDHTQMTIAEMANHLLSSLDHRLAIIAVVLAMALAGASVLLARRRRRGRSPGTPAT
jgi:hypothetical protein